MRPSLKATTWLGLGVFLLVILVPFWWITSMSFKTYEQIQFATSIYVPNPFTWENYRGCGRTRASRSGCATAWSPRWW
jgi:ABC-type glycerol-3-phosphate transport system permease component